jgi:pimeloyl-ACP methyl ester carboxylesterase
MSAPRTAAAAETIERRFVTLDGRRISYLCADGAPAAGPTLVFLHGSGVSARYWSDQLRALAPAARVVAIDLPGHGESDEAPHAGVAEYADGVARTLDELDAWPAIAIGHSLGGAVAITLTARRAADVRGLVLISSCARLPPASTSAQWLWASLPASLRRLLFFVTAKNVLFAAGASPAAVALGMRELRACRPQALAGDVAIARAMDLTEVAGTLRVPTLILCGSRDRVTPPALSRELHRLIAGSRLEIVEGGGHMLLIEASGAVNRAIAGFADAIGGRSAMATVRSTWRSYWRRALRRLARLMPRP